MGSDHVSVHGPDLLRRLVRAKPRIPPFIGINAQSIDYGYTFGFDDEAGMERASLSPAEYVAYRMKISAADAEALVAAVYALDEDAE